MNDRAHVLRPEELVVRCMSWKEDGLWVAACIDLTLAAQGDTLEQARAKLQAQIVSYLREALTIDSEHAQALLSRKAAPYDRLRFRFWEAADQCRRAMARRPRLRQSVASLVRGLGVALKTPYTQPLPVTVGA
jgi:hypothetical protein